jgi:hypothetical protein
MRNKVDSQRSEFLKCEHQLLSGTSESIETENDDYLKCAASGVDHQLIQTGASFFRAAGSVAVDPVQLPAPVDHQILERLLLHSGVLIESRSLPMSGFVGGRNAYIDRCPGHG